MYIELNKKKWLASPITNHKCFLGKGCDLWWRKDSVSITCGLTNFIEIHKLIKE